MFFYTFITLNNITNFFLFNKFIIILSHVFNKFKKKISNFFEAVTQHLSPSLLNSKQSNRFLNHLDCGNYPELNTF